MAEERNQLFLTNVHLKGFKSIVDVDVEIKKGLNILIGKNGAGKSNFLEGINEALENEVLRSPSFYSTELTFVSDYDINFKIYSERILKKIKEEKNKFGRADDIKMIQKVLRNDEIIFDTSFLKEELRTNDNNAQILGTNAYSIVYDRDYEYYDITLIKYNLPEKIRFVNESDTFTLFHDDWEHDLHPKDSKMLSFIRDVFLEFYLSDDLPEKFDKSLFYKELEIPNSIKSNLNLFTPIENIRFNPNINVYDTDKEVVIDNIKIDFKINGNWLPWSQLSDGTKRLFYMVAEITSHQGGLVLIEEPELGVHPHQFDKIMQFLKEQAEDKQIIVSTHSPQALNHLTVDELDHLMIAKYDNKKGTQIKHLTPAQTKKAKAYINKVGFFSDYWLSSDLE